MQTVDIEIVNQHLDAIDAAVNHPPYDGRHQCIRDRVTQAKRALNYQAGGQTESHGAWWLRVFKSVGIWG